MEDFNSYEYTAERRAEGAWLLLKILMIVGYIAFAVGYFVVIYVTRVFPLGALIPFFLWILIHFTWRYVNPDLKYTVEHGTLTYFVIYHKKSGRKKLEIKISDAIEIAPKSQIKDKIAAFSPNRIYSALPSKKSADAYALLYTDSHGKRCVFYFVATAAALKLLRIYNSKTVITKVTV